MIAFVGQKNLRDRRSAFGRRDRDIELDRISNTGEGERLGNHHAVRPPGLEIPAYLWLSPLS